MVSKEHLVPFSVTFFAYASELSLQLNINFFITNGKEKNYIGIQTKSQATITKENEGRFFNDYVEVT